MSNGPFLRCFGDGDTCWIVRRYAGCQESEVEVAQIFREAGFLVGMRDWLQRSREEAGHLLP